MRVAELYQRHEFRLVETPVSDPAPGELQVRVEACGVCGSDLHYFSEGGICGTPSVYPMVIGHEPAGVVVKPGSGVTGWAPGDRVALEPAIYCYHCEQCLTGHHNLCSRLRFLSTPPDPGFFRQYVNLPAANVLPLPAGIGFQEGTLFEPLAVVLHSLRLAQLQPGETVAVFGAGPIGLLTVVALKLSGASRVWSVEPVAARRDLALRIGADAAIDPGEVDPVRQILADTAGRGVDAALDCATRGSSLNHSIEVARRGGRVVVTGIPSNARSAVDFHAMRRKELVLFNVRRSNHDSASALDLLREQRARFAPILTHEVPLEDVQQAFTKLESYQDGMAKVVIRMT
jgi:L-iditol 2-dehydrogenase